MILGRFEILRRLNYGEIFRKDTWDREALQEASYALRIADDGLLIDDIFYPPGVPFTGGYINIEPGKIAILSTKELLNMPANLVGKIGIRLEYALLGLTGLMGIQVDPLFGHDKEDERLYIRVANFGNEPIRLSPGYKVFTFELHEVVGQVPRIPKESSWPRIKRSLDHQSHPSWSYVIRAEDNLSKQTKALENQLLSETEKLQQHLQPLVLFGIFLVAVTILSVALSVIISGRDTPEVYVPSWVTNWGWVFLLLTLGIATITTGAMGAVMIYRLWKRE